MRLFLCLCVLSLSWGCGTLPQVKKEASKSKTEFTIPANSVFVFDSVTVKPSSAVPVQIDKEESKSTPPSPLDTAKASALEKFYWLGGILALVAALLLWRGHVKAGVIAITGAICAPMLAKFYSSDATQYVALAALCVAGALFAAWHMMIKRTQPRASPSEVE